MKWALWHTVEEGCADIIISTAHKAKGREWSTVRVMDDFLRSQAKRPGGSVAPDNFTQAHDPAEVRLFYVALTRAREAIEIAPAVMAMVGIRPVCATP